MKKLFLLILLVFPLLLHRPSSGETAGYLVEKALKAFLGYARPQEFNELELTGPDRLCNEFGSVLGSFSGGGIPSTDVYFWKIIDPTGVVVFDRFGGFETIAFTFSKNGDYRIELKVQRGGVEVYADFMVTTVIEGPIPALDNNYKFCEGDLVNLTALDPASPNFDDYQIEWFDQGGASIGTGNNISLNLEGNYSVVYYIPGENSTKVCENQAFTTLSKIQDYQIIASETVVCPDLATELSTTPTIIGTWYYQKSGSSSRTELGKGDSFSLLPNQYLIEGEGIYTIFFTPDPSQNPTCLTEKSLSLTYNPQPEFIVSPSLAASDCDTFDGALTITAVTPLDKVEIQGYGISTPPLLVGETFTISGLKSGTYSLLGVLGNCSNGYGSYIPLANPPSQLVFSIENILGEECTQNGKLEGSFIVQFQNPPSTGSIRIINKKGTLVQENTFVNVSQIPISIPGGDYFVEILGENDCNIPEASEVQVPSLNQTQFSVPAQISVCQSFDLLPETSEDLEFTFIDPAGISVTLPKGEIFSITQGGEYSVIGTHLSDPDFCPTEKKIIVTLVDPVDFEPILINQDCFGNRTYEADIYGRDPATVIFSWFDEKDALVGTGQFLNPVSNGTFKLDVQPANSATCPIPPVEFEIKEPVLTVDLTLESTKLCEYGPRAILSLASTFPEEITDIEWRRYDALGNIEFLDQFKDQLQVIADVEGTYEAAVFSRIPSINKDCELGRSSIPISLVIDKVEFEIPSSLSICDPYPLIPQSSQNLEYSLTFPDGKIEVKNWNEAFSLDQAGTYTLLGYDPDIKGPRCPEQKTIDVIINPPVQFEPVLVNVTCDGIYEYLAEVSNYPADAVDYFWRDPSGNLVSSAASLTSSSYGTYSLEVQPKGSIPCQIVPFSFEIPVPIFAIEVRLLAEPLCPDQPNASLKIEADLTEIKTIEWWFTDIDNNKNQLSSETNKTEILAVNEGTYEVILINQFGCVLGNDQVLVLRSTDQVRPVLEESYQVCPRYEIGPVLDPGSFASYEWYFGDNLVSTSPTFKPLQVGVYQLVVFSTEGCAYETTFVTEEECDLRLVFPNAIQPGNPDKPFLIYTNYLIDELEIWIFSKWGEVIFHCESIQLLTEESTCIWDGYFNGQKVPPGSYAYRVNFKNLEKNISEEQLGSILVID